MVMPFLNSSIIQTGMEENTVWFTINRGVAQGSPLSPCLYNIFMDTLQKLSAKRLSRPQENRANSLQTMSSYRR